MGGLGALPLLSPGRSQPRWLGWANALAAGLMLGAGYALMDVGADREPLSGAVGAALGVGFVFLTQLVWEAAEGDRAESSPAYGYQVFLRNTLHSAAEGVAIGVAMALDLSFGIFVALAIGVHNIPEAAVLGAVFTGRGHSRPEAAGIAVVTDLSQVFLSVFVFVVVQAAPSILPFAVGFAVGTLVYLVMADLLPESYRHAGPTTIGLVTVVSLGIIVLLGGLRW